MGRHHICADERRFTWGIAPGASSGVLASILEKTHHAHHRLHK